MNTRIKLLRQLLSLLALVALVVGCSSGANNPSRAALKVSPPPFHLGSHSFPITTKNPEAQQAFDRGLTLAYAFSHMAAEQEFRKAATLDPNAAMPWWGVALVNGPHINYPIVPEEKAAVAWDALTQARARMADTTPLERALIDSLSSRYVEKQPSDRSSLDSAYAASMKQVYRTYPTNADVAVLYAESLMDLHPWDLWQHSGAAKPWTPEILTTLEQAIALNKNHPGAHHLYIHAVEGSHAPERGVPSADILRDLVPGAGHLVHMPAHIYLRAGRLEDAALANINAIKADEEFRKIHPKPGFYAIYMLHNHHFLSFTRMMQGQRESALQAARSMIAGIPPEFLKEFGPIADGYMAIVSEVLMRFGKWDEVLAQPEPAETLPLARAMRLFTRTAALTALDRPKEARVERQKFLDAVKRVPKDATFGNNSAHTLLQIARHVLDGEIAARSNQLDKAIRSLTTAMQIEDTLMYDEPPDWILPVRHSLGAVLLKAKKGMEAERVYREDLQKFPENGWSLYGLSQALTAQGRHDEAETMLQRFKTAWSKSDTEIASSCLCLNDRFTR